MASEDRGKFQTKKDEGLVEELIPSTIDDIEIETEATIINRRVRIVFGIAMIFFLIMSFPRIFAHIPVDKTPFPVPVSKNPQPPIPIAAQLQPIQLPPQQPSPSTNFIQIDDTLSVSLSTGEIGIIKYLARIDSNNQDAVGYRILVSNAIQDLMVLSSSKELHQSALFRMRLMKKLSNKKIKDIHIEPSLELLKASKPNISMGDPLRF